MSRRNNQRAAGQPVRQQAPGNAQQPRQVDMRRNPLYPDRIESNALGVLIAFVAIIVAIVALALIVKNFSYPAREQRAYIARMNAEQEQADFTESQIAEDTDVYDGYEDMDVYGDDPCEIFAPKLNFSDSRYNEKTLRLITQMHKAITIIQLKLEAAIIDRRPELGMGNRKLLHLIDFERGVFMYDGKEYALRDTNFPTIDPADPYRLTEEEHDLMEKIHASFMNSEKLKKHMRCLFTYGGMYLVCNSNLLYHASVPLNADGSFKHVVINGKEYWGEKLLKKVDQLVRTAYFGEDGSDEKAFALDYMWYMWCGPDAPSFDKDKMATFERYFVEDKSLHKETKGYYYTLRNEVEVCNRILREFGIDPEAHAHIINGHVPVKTIKGEQPIKAEGKMLVIDGGFSKAYQPETGIAGYTLVYHSHGLQLVQHEPFQSRQKAIEEGQDIKSTTFLVEFNSQRMMVKDTDKGRELRTQIEDLKKLLVAYRTGLIKEHV